MLAILPTAANTASFAIRPNDSYLSVQQDEINEKVLERYLSMWFTAPRTRLEADPDTSLQGPSHLAANWLGEVQDRIERSIMPGGEENDGRWLSEEIAAAGATFFELTSDILPSEPYLYSSKRGDLVAEFETKSGSMTGIITRDVAVLFAVIDGVPFEGRLMLGNSRDITRQKLREFTETLNKQQHGPVATRSK